jgi:hypothetical protein
MGKRGPKSANKLKILDKPSGQTIFGYLSPIGRGLSKSEQAEWVRRVEAKAPGFYCEDDAGLLVQLCQAVVDRNQLRRMKIRTEAAKDDKFLLHILASWRTQARLVSSISRQLKIGAVSRETHRAAAKAAKAGLPEAKGPLARAGLMFSDKDEDPTDRLN